jgi:oligopeptidase B
MPTTTSYVGSRWNPLVENNWGIVYTFIRGGGDHTDSWAKAGRRSGREKTVDDYISCIQHVKTQYNINPRNIVLYGRSAGGLLIGNSLQRYNDGSLFRGIFTEVPYVDELRTTTNPELPLTQLEYNEFGDPVHRLADFLSVGLTSPADAAVGLKTPKIFVYCKTASNDSQVYTYEPIKWIERLRKSSPEGAPKLVNIDLHSGHFTPPELSRENYTLDACILDAWVHGEF